MKEPVTIALDAMGGDNAPQIVVAGANIARRRHPNINFIFFGDEPEIEKHLSKFRRLKEVVEIHHTTETVKPEDKPSFVLRNGRNTSMWWAVNSVKVGQSSGVVSAGNTGALMALTMYQWRNLTGIDRPAIASFFPTLRGETVMLDLGANISCDADNLVQFAVMGEVYSRTILGIDDPTVGLLNVGEEETKGNDSLKEAAEIIKEIDFPGEVVGFVEGNDIPAGVVDVVVTDGFTGNIALKTAEGTATLINGFVREAFRNSFMAKIGYLFAKHSLDKLRNRSDPRRYNGAMFLGLNGICVKSHGGTDALGFATAIGVAVDMIEYGGNQMIADHIARLGLSETRM